MGADFVETAHYLQYDAWDVDPFNPQGFVFEQVCCACRSCGCAVLLSALSPPFLNPLCVLCYVPFPDRVYCPG